MTSLGNKTSLVWIVNIKRGIGIYTKTMPFLSEHGSCIIRMMCFIFQGVGKVNGIHIPSTIGIQTPSQMQSMFSIGENGAISMDATFETMMSNFIYSHWLCLMRIDPMSLSLGSNMWWLSVVAHSFEDNILRWKCSCFIIDDDKRVEKYPHPKSTPSLLTQKVLQYSHF